MPARIPVKALGALGKNLELTHAVMLAHDVWREWMNHLFSKCHPIPSSESIMTGLVIPKELVERWKRQMTTPYDDLAPCEQASDLKIADRYLEEL